MATATREQLKSWFKKGLYPLESHFASWIDSYWHKNDTIPVNAIENLLTYLNAKADVLHTHAASDIAGLADLLEGMTTLIAGKADRNHTHTLDDITNIDEFKVEVDSELSDTSENPVQNKVIAEALKNAGSKVEVDTELSGSSENPVQNKVIHAAMEQKQSVSDNSLQTNAKTIPAAINEVLQKTVDFNKSYDINFEGKDSTMATETQYKKTGIVIKRIQTLNVGSLTLAIINNGYQTLSLTDGGIDPVTKLKIAYWEPEEGENGISAAYLAQLIWTISKVNTSTIAGISIYYE